MFAKRVGLTARPGLVVVVATGATLLASPAARAQEWIRGVVAEVETGEPIERATVLLIGAQDAVVGATLSDSAGRFELAVPEPGEYTLRVSRFGYRPVRSRLVDVPAAAAVETRAHLSPDAVVLDAVTVVSEALPREREWFERRRRQRRGYNFNRADIERLRATRVLDLLEWVPGFRARTVRSDGTTRPSLILNFRGCPPVLFVDGRKSLLPPSEILERLPLVHVYGVEVFRNWSDVPVEFDAGAFLDGGDLRCGAIAIWTRWRMER